MNKKTILICILLVCAIVLACILLFTSNDKKQSESTDAESQTLDLNPVNTATEPTPTLPAGLISPEEFEALPNAEPVNSSATPTAAPTNNSPDTENNNDSSISTPVPTTKPDAPEQPESSTTPPSINTEEGEDKDNADNNNSTNSGSCCEYGSYLSLSAAEQEEFMNQFASAMDFISWSKSAQAEHDAHTVIESIEGDVIDISQFINQ